MYILNHQKNCIHNSEDIQRFAIVPKEDGVWLISAAISTREPLLTLGRYYSKTKAEEVFGDLFAALGGGASYFEMPTQSDVNEEAKKHDARVKRKGGS